MESKIIFGLVIVSMVSCFIGFVYIDSQVENDNSIDDYNEMKDEQASVIMEYADESYAEQDYHLAYYYYTELLDHYGSSIERTGSKEYVLYRASIAAFKIDFFEESIYWAEELMELDSTNPKYAKWFEYLKQLGY